LDKTVKVSNGIWGTCTSEISTGTLLSPLGIGDECPSAYRISPRSRPSVVACLLSWQTQGRLAKLSLR